MPALKNLTTFLFLFIILSGCTTIPLSYSNDSFDNRLLNGYWISKSAKDAYKFVKNTQNQIKMYSYEYKQASNGWVKNSGDIDITSTSITDNKGTVNFLSLKTADKEYGHIAYEFTSSGVVTKTVNDEGFKYTTTEALKQIIKSKLRQASLFNDTDNYTLQSTIAIVEENNKPNTSKTPNISSTPAPSYSQQPTCYSPSYEITSMKTKQYIRDLQSWDDWTPISDVSGTGSTLKFFDNGILMKLSDGQQLVTFNLANVSYQKTQDGLNVYTALIRKDGDIIGNASIVIYNYSYSQMLKGPVCDAYVGVTIDNTNFSNFLDNLLKGSNSTQFLFSVKSIPR